MLEDDGVSSNNVSDPDLGLEEEVDNESDELRSSCDFLFSLAGPFLPKRLGRSSSEDSSLSLEPLWSDESFQGPLLSLWPQALPSTANFIPWGMLFPFPNLTAVDAFGRSFLDTVSLGPAMLIDVITSLNPVGLTGRLLLHFSCFLERPPGLPVSMGFRCSWFSSGSSGSSELRLFSPLLSSLSNQSRKYLLGRPPLSESEFSSSKFLSTSESSDLFLLPWVWTCLQVPSLDSEPTLGSSVLGLFNTKVEDLSLACGPVDVLSVEGSSVESFTDDLDSVESLSDDLDLVESLSDDLDSVEFRFTSGTAGESPFDSTAWRGSSVS